MKTNSYHWDHPTLKPYLERFPAGGLLFRQGEKGTEMFIILQGLISLSAEKKGKETVLDFIAAGEMVGEQSVFNTHDYPRAFTAHSASASTVLKLTAADLDTIQKQDPLLMHDLHQEMFRVAANRLKRANEITQILRSSQNVERLVGLILHFANHSGTTTPGGKEVYFTRETIRYYIDMPDFEIEAALSEMARQKLLIPQGGDLYAIQNEKLLKNEVKSVADAIPNIPAI